MAKCGIYKITNLINGKCYIGQSVDILRRWRNHKETSKNSSKEAYEYPLYRAFRKYGIENFSFEILEECKKEELDIKETFYINKYNSLDEGYNQVLVGQGGTKVTPQEVNLIKYDLIHTTLSSDEIGEKYGYSGRSVRAINIGETWREENESYPLRKKFTHNQKNYCQDCGCEISLQANRCVTCENLKRKQDAIEQKPVTREELKELIRTVPFTQIAEKFGVTDNAIRKWCDLYNLPRKKSEIKKISEEDWKTI